MFSSLSSRPLRLMSAILMGCVIFPVYGHAQDTPPNLLEQPPAAEAPVPSEETPPPVTTEAEPVVPMPDAATLETPTPETLTPVTEQDVPTIPALPVPEGADENLFFDAEALVPTGEMGTKGGPRKVNPALEPASKYIVVKKNYSADSKNAQLVAAERAMKLGRYESALEMYERMYETNKRDPNILLGRATALQQMDRGEAAVQAYDELLALRPDNVEAQINMLGLMAKRYPAVALRRLLDLRDAHPNNVGVAAQIAVVQAELGKYDEAIQYLGIAAGMEPNNAAHLFNMAVIADRTGAKKDAMKYYEQALDVDTVYGGGRSIPREAVFERLSQLR
jgi:Flp pilus assembly protein TadD